MSFRARADIRADFPDPRTRHGRRFALLSLLCLVTLGLLLGRKSLAAIRCLQRDRGPDCMLALGFARTSVPVPSCLARLFRRLNGAVGERALDHRPPADGISGGPDSLPGRLSEGMAW